MKRLEILLTVALVSLFAAAFGQVTLFPGVRLQGALKDAGGNPVSGSVTVQVHIYTAPTGGTPLYTETFGRTLSAGILDVILGVGQGTATGDLQAALAATQTEPERWLGIVVNSDPELSPRAMLNSTPHSFRVGTVDGAAGGTITGDVNVAGAMDAKNLVLRDPGPISTPLSIQGSAGQTANLVEVLDPSSVPLLTVGATGAMNVKDMVLKSPGPQQTPLVIQGSAGQTANLVEVLDNSSVPLLTVGATGAMEGKNLVLKQPGPGQTPLVVEGSPGQTANLVEIKDASGAPLVWVGSAGAMEGKNLVLKGPGPVGTPLSIQGSSGQTANLLEIKNSDGGVLAGVDFDGAIFLADGITATPPHLLEARRGSNESATIGGFKTATGDQTKIEFISPTAGGHLLIRPAAGGNVGIGVAVPHSPLQVGGAISVPVHTVASCLPYTLDETHSVVLVDNSSTDVCVVNLPTAVGIKGRQYTIKRINGIFTGDAVIDPFGGETIDNNALYLLDVPNKYITIISDGANWMIIGNN